MHPRSGSRQLQRYGTCLLVCIRPTVPSLNVSRRRAQPLILHMQDSNSGNNTYQFGLMIYDSGRTRRYPNKSEINPDLSSYLILASGRYYCVDFRPQTPALGHLDQQRQRALNNKIIMVASSLSAVHVSLRLCLLSFSSS